MASGSIITDYFHNKASAYRFPLNGTFELTPMCNFRCSMCYVRLDKAQVDAHPRRMMEFEDWMKIAEDAVKNGMLYLLLTGGEPLSWPHFWQLYENLCRMGLLISINTNGSLIDDEAIERFKKNPPRRINITLYGASDETYESLCGAKGQYTKVVNAITKLQDAGITVKINCSLTPHNCADLEKMVSFAKERKLLFQVATYMFPPLRADSSKVGMNDRFTPEESAYYNMKNKKLQSEEAEYRKYLESLLNGYVQPPGLDESCEDPIDGKIRCRAGKASFWITWDGMMHGCGMMPEPNVDIVGREFMTGWRELTSIYDSLHTSGICEGCSNFKICHPCAAMAMTETGEISGIPQYLCKVVEAMKNIAQQELSEK